MQTTEKIGRNMQASRKSNLPRFSINNVSISKSHDSKGKEIEPEDKDQTKDSVKEITELMKQMMVNHTSQLNAFQSRLMTMEKTHIAQNQRSFQLRPNQEWKSILPKSRDLLTNLKQITWLMRFLPIADLVKNSMKNLLVQIFATSWNKNR